MSKEKKDPAVYVWDMLDHVDFFERRVNKDNFWEETIRLASLRAFTVLGEAAKRVDKATRERAPDIPWQKIIDTRNVISHDYEELNLKEIWKIIETDLPELKKNLLALYKELTGTDYYAH